MTHHGIVEMVISEKEMKTNTAREIKRLRDGSIDYGYYAGIAHIARHEEIKASLGKAIGLAVRHGSVVSIVGMVLLVPFVIS